MLKMKYVGLKTEYNVKFSRVSQNVVQVIGDVPVKTHGFQLSRDGKNDYSKMDYSEYTTVYRELEGGIQFSNDESVYEEPEPVPEPEPYEPTLKEVQEAKVVEMNTVQQAIIQQGIDVVLSDGATEHFTLTDHDQTSLMGLSEIK